MALQPSQLEILPREILLDICQYLDQKDLEAVSRLSKSCSAVASALLFRTIHIGGFDNILQVGLHVEFERWLVFLRRRDCLEQVHRIVATRKELKIHITDANNWS